ncbi:chitinase [Leifsonia sp. Root227]|uniref:cellulase N-terminal Ig-like domain-containing protein n=1 Tax=unclassified Leifsonia TaxID=2663824 RepID=UPI0006FBBEBC|nr:cellulase N-terminal Ig-like domain-containing protein [Leifsonia sp. Root227]KRC47029.1 chitinase [Leifsonia sp. Root227]
MEAVGSSPVVLVNHLGYDSAAPKAAIVAAPAGAVVERLRIVSAQGDERATVDAFPTASTPEQVPGWRSAAYARFDFSELTQQGSYRAVATVDGVEVRSAPFVVAEHRIPSLVVSDVTAYFRSQRSSGEIDRKDAAARFYGDDSGRTVDARGGWLDASGDYSKFLSHLTYTRMMSPQQIPLCAWALLTAGRELREAHQAFETSQYPRLRDEGLFGADFLVRFQSDDGYFYTGIFDALTKDLDERVINAPLQDSVRTQRWQAAYRHGGGLAIAALALASTQDASGDVDADTYFASAVRGFEHLEAHNAEYLFDGQESALDDYCALLAAAELADAAAARGADAGAFLDAAARRADALTARVRRDGSGAAYLVGDVDGRPYFHAAESGLPVVALLRYADVIEQRAGAAATTTATDATAAAARATAIDLIRGTIARVDAVPNPFGYLRQRVQPVGGEPRDAFFFPHENETGYWWQGENAGISSVAYAASRASIVPECDDATRERLRRLAADLTSWVGGLNPFDSCMIQGRGRNTVEYSGVYQNSPGGIVNGITGGWTDEDDIAFLPADASDGNEWRWAEQWIPHSAWFLLAVCAQR